MPLPPLLEVVPLAAPVRAEVVVPGSKSLTNRALVLAALGRGATRLRGALWSDDTQVMVEALRQLGFDVQVDPDPAEPANRTIRVEGQGGAIPRAGTPAAPLEIFVGNAGTATRFLTALLCLGRGSYRLSGVPRMHERPQQELVVALRGLGYQVDTPNDRLPLVVHGTGPRPGRVQVSAQHSSQFASALLLAGGVGGWQVEVSGQNADEQPYVEMTRGLIRAFPAGGGDVEFDIEPDASSGSYFWGAGWLLGRGAATAGSQVTVRGWPTSGWQIDAEFPGYLPLPVEISRERHLGDSIMTAIVLAPFADRATRFVDLGRLRVQECERVAALRTELEKCGARVEETGDTLVVHPGALHGAEIDTYGDHRMAMCFAMLGLAVPGIRVRDPACVAKTFPNFFAKLAAAAPGGLGALVRGAVQGAVVQGSADQTPLAGADLVA
jgi:3-phosphoshikimate 1-carboxyvinyltransferase